MMALRTAQQVSAVAAAALAFAMPTGAAQAQEIGEPITIASLAADDAATFHLTTATPNVEAEAGQGPQFGGQSQAPLRQVARDEALMLEQALQRRRTARREIAYQVLNAVDAVQTISCLERGVCHEMNPLLGRSPSPGKVLAFKAASGGVHYLVTRLLEAEAPGAVNGWQITTIAIQGGVVAWNMQFVF